ncbi:zinc ribbon domain-containing protein [Mycobacterium lepromatosis]|uniref:zinc ribbon domain-containing protein n=1 Tax=Mycobacterium lepromatosis TaxID=480418 RepID=UPI001F3146C7|nr:zinc ribbon domain-containing protein [Mycobacterium lepromatosis]
MDAELSRIAHRTTYLPQREADERMRVESTIASDRLTAVRIALEEIDSQVLLLDSEIDAARQREDQDRSLLHSEATDAKQLSDLQYQLGIWRPRKTSLEDSLLEFMKRSKGLQDQLIAELGAIEGMQTDLDVARQGLDAAIAGIDQTSQPHSSRCDVLIAELAPALSALYERLCAAGGLGVSQLQGHPCRACRSEISHGELSCISVDADDEVVSYPESGASQLLVKGFDQ